MTFVQKLKTKMEFDSKIPALEKTIQVLKKELFDEREHYERELQEMSSRHLQKASEMQALLDKVEKFQFLL